MTGTAINPKCEAPEPRELSSGELDAVSGGDKQSQMENKKQADAVKAFQQLLQEI